MIRFEKFDADANRVINAGIEKAQENGSTYVGTEHLLYGILSHGRDALSGQLRRLCGPADRLNEWMLDGEERGNKTVLSYQSFSPRARRVIQMAVVYGTRGYRGQIGTAQIIHALLEDHDATAGSFLRYCGCDCSKLLEMTRNITCMSELSSDSHGDKRTFKAAFWNKLGRNLTQAAQEGKLSPVIGRDAEIERVMCILGRRTKNNPCLIGEPGVGKTAVIEGIAQRIAQGKVPFFLRDKIIVELDIASLVAGTKYRGDFEDRMHNLIEEAKKDESVLLFIDELHLIVGTGAAEGSVDAANLLKPALARGEFRLIGATTLNEYRKSIEPDGALDRRFQTVIINEPNFQETEQILKGLRPTLERFHHVMLSDEAILQAISLSARYQPAKFFPDKAIDVLDEACAQMGFCSENENTEEQMVTGTHIAGVLKRSLGIEFTTSNTALLEKMQHLSKDLSKKIIGQDEAVRIVSDTLLCASAGLRDTHKPLASFMFSGLSGTGKTHFAKILSEVLFGDTQSILRFDLSEYMESMSVSLLIGAAPGYVGYGEGGRLTEAVRRRPYCVLLLDEFEKAHPDVRNLFLQMLDEGHLTDAQGRKVSFANVVVIMTTNAGVAHSVIGFENDSISKMRSIKAAFTPELVQRIDRIIPFRALNEDDYTRIAELQLIDFSNRIRQIQQEIIISDEIAGVIGRRCVKKGAGAREIQNMIHSEISVPIAHLLATNCRDNRFMVQLENDNIKVEAFSMTCTGALR